MAVLVLEPASHGMGVGFSPEKADKTLPDKVISLGRNLTPWPISTETMGHWHSPLSTKSEGTPKRDQEGKDK